LPAEWADWLLAEADREAAGESVAVTARTRAFSEDIQSLDDRLNRLMTAYVESVLSLAEYREAKNKLMDEKRQLTENLTTVEKNQSSAFEPIKTFINTAKQAGILAETGTNEQKRDFFKKVASNPNVFNRKVRWDPRGAWQLVIRQGSFAHHTTAPAIAGAVVTGENHQVDSMRRR
jgi:hypothetical protein